LSDLLGVDTIGTTYSWFLSQAGNDMTHYVRKEKLNDYLINGIKINCWDKRRFFKKIIKTVYEPKFVDNIESSHDYDYIIVALKSGQLATILEILKDNAGKSTILILQNLSFNELKLIVEKLNSSQYLLGFPPIGGGRLNNVVESVIFGLPTIIGETGGEITDKVKEVKKLLELANLKTKISSEIIPYLKTHFLTIAALLAPYFMTGSYDRTIKPFYIRKSILAMREVFEICRKEGIETKKMKESKIFYYPMWLLIPLLYYIFKNKTFRRICEGDLVQGGEWIPIMYYYIYEEGKRLNIDFPVYESFKPYVDNYSNK
jgi:ketopantoate reductase